MNPNFEGEQMKPEGELSEGELSGGGELAFSKAQYPELEGLKDGSPIKVRCEGTISSSDGDMVYITPTSCEFETEGQADREMKEMSKQQIPAGSGNSNDAGDF